MSKVQKNDFNISGRVIHVGMPMHISDNFQKRILVLEVYVGNNFRQEIPFEFVNENMSLLNNIRENQWVNIDFQIRGRKGKIKDGRGIWYPSIEGLSCVKQD